jgi:hypothetical protein
MTRPDNKREARAALAADLERHPGWTTDPSRNRAQDDDFGTDPKRALKVAGVCAFWVVVYVAWRAWV